MEIGGSLLILALGLALSSHKNAVTAAAATSSSHLVLHETRITAITRQNNGDVFITEGKDCSVELCIGMSSGTAGAPRALGAAAPSCACQCHSHLPAFREDLQICVDDIHECVVSPFVSGSTSQQIPFVFLPLKGQIIHPSREISFAGIRTPVCAVSGAKFLTDGGWIELRSPLDADVPFRLFRDEGRTFLQWVGEPDLRSRMGGRLVLVHLMCREIAKSEKTTPESDPVVFTPCVAFRVVGTPEKYLSNVSEVVFVPDSTGAQNTSSTGLSVSEYVAIGVCSILLGLIYVASVFLYLHLRKRRKIAEKKLERRDNPNLTAAEEGIIKSNPLLSLGRHFVSVDTGYSDSCSSDNEASPPDILQNQEDRINKITAAMIHPQLFGSKFIQSSLQLQQHHQPVHQESIEKLPEENVSIVETMECREDRPDSLKMMGTTRRKLYFNPAYFDPQLLIAPPPAAIEFLTKIREVISLAKQKMAAKRFTPSLIEIPEEEPNSFVQYDLNSEHGRALGSRRGSAISLKRENSRRKTCSGCPGCEPTALTGKLPEFPSLAACENCASLNAESKRNSIRKWLEDVPMKSDNLEMLQDKEKPVALSGKKAKKKIRSPARSISPVDEITPILRKSFPANRSSSPVSHDNKTTTSSVKSGNSSRRSSSTVKTAIVAKKAVIAKPKAPPPPVPKAPNIYDVILERKSLPDMVSEAMALETLETLETLKSLNKRKHGDDKDAIDDTLKNLSDRGVLKNLENLNSREAFEALKSLSDRGVLKNSERLKTLKSLGDGMLKYNESLETLKSPSERGILKKNEHLNSLNSSNKNGVQDSDAFEALKSLRNLDDKKALGVLRSICNVDGKRAFSSTNSNGEIVKSVQNDGLDHSEALEALKTLQSLKNLDDSELLGALKRLQTLNGESVEGTCDDFNEQQRNDGDFDERKRNYEGAGNNEGCRNSGGIIMQEKQRGKSIVAENHGKSEQFKGQNGEGFNMQGHNMHKSNNGGFNMRGNNNMQHNGTTATRHIEDGHRSRQNAGEMTNEKRFISSDGFNANTSERIEDYNTSVDYEADSLERSRDAKSRNFNSHYGDAVADVIADVSSSSQPSPSLSSALPLDEEMTMRNAIINTRTGNQTISRLNMEEVLSGPDSDHDYEVIVLKKGNMDETSSRETQILNGGVFMNQEGVFMTREAFLRNQEGDALPNPKDLRGKDKNNFVDREGIFVNREGVFITKEAFLRNRNNRGNLVSDFAKGDGVFAGQEGVFLTKDAFENHDDILINTRDFLEKNKHAFVDQEGCLIDAEALLKNYANVFVNRDGILLTKNDANLPELLRQPQQNNKNCYSLVSEVYVNNGYNYGSSPSSNSSTLERKPRIIYQENDPEEGGKLLIEVEDCPDNYIRTEEDSDAYEPDTLDRKPKLKLVKDFVGEGEFVDSLERPQQPGQQLKQQEELQQWQQLIQQNQVPRGTEDLQRWNQQNQQQQILLRSAGTFVKEDSIDSSEFKRNFGSLREIYQAKNKRQDLLRYDFEGRILTLEERHCRRQRRSPGNPAPDVIPPCDAEEVIYERPKPPRKVLLRLVDGAEPKPPLPPKNGTIRTDSKNGIKTHGSDMQKDSSGLHSNQAGFHQGENSFRENEQISFTFDGCGKGANNNSIPSNCGSASSGNQSGFPESEDSFRENRETFNNPNGNLVEDSKNSSGFHRGSPHGTNSFGSAKNQEINSLPNKAINFDGCSPFNSNSTDKNAHNFNRSFTGDSRDSSGFPEGSNSSGTAQNQRISSVGYSVRGSVGSSVGSSIGISGNTTNPTFENTAASNKNWIEKTAQNFNSFAEARSHQRFPEGELSPGSKINSTAASNGNSVEKTTFCSSKNKTNPAQDNPPQTNGAISQTNHQSALPGNPKFADASVLKNFIHVEGAVFKNCANEQIVSRAAEIINTKKTWGEITAKKKRDDLGYLSTDSEGEEGKKDDCDLGSETDESLGDGHSESGAESVETHSVFFGSFRKPTCVAGSLDSGVGSEGKHAKGIAGLGRKN